MDCNLRRVPLLLSLGCKKTQLNVHCSLPNNQISRYNLSISLRPQAKKCILSKPGPNQLNPTSPRIKEIRQHKVRCRNGDEHLEQDRFTGSRITVVSIDFRQSSFKKSQIMKCSILRALGGSANPSLAYAIHLFVAASTIAQVCCQSL